MESKSTYSTQYYWSIIFPILLLIIVGTWILLIFMYPSAADISRKATQQLQSLNVR